VAISKQVTAFLLHTETDGWYEVPEFLGDVRSGI
jgi:hypothetical protein